MGSKSDLETVYDMIIESLHNNNIPFEDESDYIVVHNNGQDYKIQISRM